MLTLKEELFITLHYNPKKGALVKLAPSTSELISSGGTLVELMLADRVRLDEDEQKLVVTDTSSTGDDILDEMVTRLAPAQPLQLNEGGWILPVIQKATIGHRVLARLHERGILSRAEERAMFGLSRSTIYPLDAAVVQDLTQRQRAVMVNGAKPDLQTATLLFLVSVWSGITMFSLSGKEKKAYNQRWDALFGDYWGQFPVDHAMEPIDGLAPAIRQAIGLTAVSWATVQAEYVIADTQAWSTILREIDII